MKFLIVVVVAVALAIAKVTAEEAAETPFVAPSYCSLPARVGDEDRACEALFHKWAWSPTDNSCFDFVYGGCGGNDNKFNSKEECEHVCGGKPLP